MIDALLSLYCGYFLIFWLSLLFYYSWEQDPPLPFEELSFEELSSEDLTFVELDRDKFVLQFDDLDPNSEEGEPPSLPDKNSEDYKLTLEEDQVHLTNALNTFKIAKTTYGMTKDVLKEIGDKTFKGVDSKCGLLSSGCGLGNPGACVWGAVCLVLMLVLILSLSFGYYSVLVAYHLAGITYESMAIGKHNYAKRTHKNQYKSDKWMTYSLQKMNNIMYDDYIKLNENIFEQHRIMNDNIFQQNYILNHNINAQHQTILTQMDNQHETIRTNMNNQHTTIQTNMKTQHNEMRETLQKRHLDIVIEINTYNMCATNHILYETTKAIAEAHGPDVTNGTPPPSAECRDILGLDNRRLSEGDEDKGVNRIRLTLSPGYKGVSVELGEIDEKESIVVSALSDIMKKLDMDPTVLEPKKKKPKAPKKPKHDKSSEAQDEEAAQVERDLFKRNLLAVEEVVNDKFDDVKSQIESVESHGKLVESKVESMESKVESMEKTMEEIKEMLSRSMMRGGADA